MFVILPKLFLDVLSIIMMVVLRWIVVLPCTLLRKKFIFQLEVLLYRYCKLLQDNKSAFLIKKGGAEYAADRQKLIIWLNLLLYAYEMCWTRLRECFWDKLWCCQKCCQEKMFIFYLKFLLYKHDRESAFDGKWILYGYRNATPILLVLLAITFEVLHRWGAIYFDKLMLKENVSKNLCHQKPR